MRLRGLHAQGALTMEDALARLGAGKLTPSDFTQLQTLIQQQQVASGAPVATPQLIAMPPMPPETVR